MDKSAFEVKYNDPGTGLFKTNTTKDIGSDDARALVTDVKENVPFTADDSYSWSFPGVTTAGGTTAYTGTLAPAITAYANRMKVQIKINATSTGAVTLSFNAVGAKKVFVNPTTQAGAGDLVLNQTYVLVYDSALDGGTGGWIVLGHCSSAASALTRWNFASSGPAPGDFPTDLSRMYVAVDDSVVAAGTWFGHDGTQWWTK